MHAQIGQFQKELGVRFEADLRGLSNQEIIDRNAEAMRCAGVPESRVETFKALGEQHARVNGLLCP